MYVVPAYYANGPPNIIVLFDLHSMLFELPFCGRFGSVEGKDEILYNLLRRRHRIRAVSNPTSAIKQTRELLVYNLISCKDRSPLFTDGKYII